MAGACPTAELLAGYLDGELDSAAVEDIQCHIRECSSCLALLAEVVEAAPATEGGDSRSAGLHGLAELGPDAMLDRYVVRRRLGAGSMGVVFEAMDPELDRLVAIKVVRAMPGPDRKREHARMLREAQAMARLSHPNLVPVLAVGTRGDDLYLVIELVEGATLRAWLAAEKRPWRAIVRAYVAAGRGLAAAHAAGIVHRDFKPDNVLIAAGRVRVIDFGLARFVGTIDEDPHVSLGSPVEQLERTATGALLGTPAYMPPEQRLDAAVDPRADQFALAVSVWEGVYGQRPFAGRSHVALIEAVERGRPQRPKAAVRVPSGLQRALERALSRRPDERFADMTAFVDAMERSLSARAGIVAGGIALAVTAGAVAVVLSDGARAHCEQEVAPRWEEPDRARLQEAFAAADPAIAGSSPTVLDAIDRRVAAWQDAYARTCTASQETSAAVRTCLDVRRLELDAVVDVIATGNADVLSRALPMVAGLPGVEACVRSPPELARIDPEVLVNEARTMREQLAVARALGDAGRYDDAIAATRPIVARAAEIGHAAVHAEASARLGQLLMDASTPVEGVALLEAAFFESREIGHDEIATEASIALVAAVGGQLARLDEVAPWVEHAEAALQRWGSRELEAALEKARGGVALRSGDPEAAITHYGRAVEIWRAAGDDGDPRLADAIDALGIANQVARHYDLALVHHERALVIRERAYGDVHPDVGYSLTNIARVLLLQGLEEPAIHYNEWVIAIDEAALGPDHLFTAIAHNNLGAAWGQLGEPAAAGAEFRAALPGFERLGADHPQHSLVLTNIGQAAAEIGDYAAAAEALERALAMRERHFGLEHPDTLACAALLGSTAASVGAHGRAVASIERALSGAAPPAGYSPIDLVGLRLTSGRSLLALERRREATEALAAARRELSLIDSPPASVVADADRLARALARP